MRFDFLACLLLIEASRSANICNPDIRDFIPNGHFVKRHGVAWDCVAHEEANGGGQLNVFGKDFQAIGAWTEQLCKLDSDGDGQSNGMELGDPDCRYVVFPGANDALVKRHGIDISHPGFADSFSHAGTTATTTATSVTESSTGTTLTTGPSTLSATSSTVTDTSVTTVTTKTRMATATTKAVTSVTTTVQDTTTLPDADPTGNDGVMSGVPAWCKQSLLTALLVAAVPCLQS